MEGKHWGIVIASGVEGFNDGDSLAAVVTLVAVPTHAGETAWAEINSFCIQSILAKLVTTPNAISIEDVVALVDGYQMGAQPLTPTGTQALSQIVAIIQATLDRKYPAPLATTKRPAW